MQKDDTLPSPDRYAEIDGQSALWVTFFHILKNGIKQQ